MAPRGNVAVSFRLTQWQLIRALLLRRFTFYTGGTVPTDAELVKLGGLPFGAHTHTRSFRAASAHTRARAALADSARRRRLAPPPRPALPVARRPSPAPRRAQASSTPRSSTGACPRRRTR